jgi:hypothetical protein
MGDWIKYRHRTKNLKKIKEMIADLKILAENTSRLFKVIQHKGYSVDISSKSDTIKDKKFLFNFEDQEYSDSKNMKKSQEIYFEIEIKSASNKNNVFTYGVGWHYRDGYWIANGGQKIYPHPDIPSDKAVATVIEIITILEYIKTRYFPNFIIEDQFEYHYNFKELSDEQLNHLKWVSSEDWRKSMGIKEKRNYLQEAKKIKNHDIKRLKRHINAYDGIMRFIKSDLKNKGFKEKNFVDPKAFMDKAVPNKEIRGYSDIYIPEKSNKSDNIIRQYHNTIDNIIIANKRKRMINLNAINKPKLKTIWVKRKDGVLQRYTKKINR